MTEFIKIKAKNILISIIAFLLVSPFLITDYLFAKGADLKQIVNMSAPDRQPTKYGGPGMDFDRDILPLTQLFGIVTSKETKKPLEGIILKVKDSKAKAVTNKNGIFKFEPCAPHFDKIILEIKDAKDEKILQTKEIQLFNTEATIEVSL